MILSYNRLIELVKSGVIKGDNLVVKGTSIDVTLSKDIMIESPAASVIDLTRSNPKHLTPIELRDTGYLMRSNQVVLATTVEELNLPNNISAKFVIKSSIGRCFLNQMQSNHIDPGFRGRITLELHNANEMHSIRLTPGIKIGQLVFEECDPVPDHAMYNITGQYNNLDTLPIISKGAK